MRGAGSAERAPRLYPRAGRGGAFSGRTAHGAGDGCARSGMAEMIAVRDLNVTFRNGSRYIHAVQGISFDVAAGETFGIVGESGSGKSTVLKAIAGLVPSMSSILEVNGRPAARRRARAERRLLQFVFQDPYASLHPRQTVDDILREPLVIH